MENHKTDESYEDICKKLDEVVVDFFSTLAQLYLEQDNLEVLMKSGFLNMSRARYSMGLKSVGIEQCDENRMKALVKISLSDDNTFTQYNGASDLDIEDKFGDLDLGEGNKSGTNVRKRAQTNSTESSHVEDVELDDIKKIDKKASLDPLKWFGVLVPPALRQSQTEFKKSTESVVTIANLKVKMSSLQNEYTDLLKQKHTLKCES